MCFGLLLGCESEAPVELEGRTEAPMVAAALRAVRPEPLIELVNNPRAFVQVGAACPAVLSVPKVDDGLRESWVGGCTTADGLVFEGRLELYDGPESAWVSGEGFAVRRSDPLHSDPLHGDKLLFALDGSVELEEQGELVLIDAAASWCGGPGPACASGLTTIDLSFTLYLAADAEAEGGPLDRYEATVTGAVDTALAPLYVEGAWRVDDSLCPSEPLGGKISLRGRDRPLVDLDGATRCDGCASWTLQGELMGSTCGLGER